MDLESKMLIIDYKFRFLVHNSMQLELKLLTIDYKFRF